MTFIGEAVKMWRTKTYESKPVNLRFKAYQVMGGSETEQKQRNETEHTVFGHVHFR